MSANDVLSRMMEASGLKTSLRLAEALGISPQAISNYRKRGVIPASLLIKFSEKFGVSLDWLVRGKGFPCGGLRPGSHQECRSGCASVSPEELVYIGKMLALFRREDRVFAIAVKSAVEAFYTHCP